MKRILVTTDFSANSLAGLRMAVRLATQIGAELHVLHIYFLPGKPAIDSADTQAKIAAEDARLTTALEKFMAPVLKGKSGSIHVKYAAEHGFIAEAGVKEYAHRHAIDLICISTRGAGKLKKVLGTTAGNLILHAGIPVIAVPKGYRSKALNRVFYASDMQHFHREMRQVTHIADMLGADIEVVHFQEPDAILPDTKAVKAKALKEFDRKIKVHYVPMANRRSLVSNMEQYFTAKKPPLVIMFTRHQRGFLEKLIDSSKTEGYVFRSNVPLMVFHKGEHI